MATRYSRNNNMDDDNIVEGTMRGGRERIPEEDEDDYRSTIAGIAEDLIRMKKKHQQTLAEAVHRSLQKRVAKAKYGNPAGSKIQVRREGLLARQNKRDLASVEASTVNRNRATLNAQLVSEQGAYFAKGKQFLMQVLQDVYDMDEDLPDELQPIGQALTKFISEALSGTFAEGGTMIGEFGLEEIALATKPLRDEDQRR
jgi:hypothetical protein